MTDFERWVAAGVAAFVATGWIEFMFWDKGDEQDE